MKYCLQIFHKIANTWEALDVGHVVQMQKI